jgi:hypothetical protein
MGKILGLFIWARARLREPSTFASLAAVCAMFGVNLDPGVVQDWLNTLTLVFGALGFFVKEGTPETKV